MKKAVVVMLMATMLMGTKVTAYAAPKDMGNGIIFDAQYYTQNNPDVVAALGTTEQALFKHYVEYGRGEGRAAFAGDKGTPAAAVAPAVRSKLALSTKNAENDAVAAGTKLVLPLGAEPSSGTTASGIYWESSWYLHYNVAWDNIYRAHSGIKYTLDDIASGEMLSECFNKNMATDGIEMYLDFGFFVDYVDQLKARGIIPQSYQLPKTYYTITSTGKKYQEGVYKFPFIVTDCPEAMGIFNSRMNYRFGTNNKPDTYPSDYTPKYLREQQQ